MNNITIIVSGENTKVTAWINWYQRKRGRKINYCGARTEDGETTMIIKEGNKENCPRIRTVRKLIVMKESEQIGE